jgi:spore maturation protein CgeB
LSTDVGFVGQRYGRRGRLVEQLLAEGFDVVAKGNGWPAGRVEPEDLAAQFCSTRVNLNFLESSAGPFQRLGIRVRGSTRADRLITRFVAPPRQLKARPFEITACGAFVLTNDSPELPEFFERKGEIAVFDGRRDLARQVRHFLSHDDERRAIADAGLRRSVEYSWVRLFGSLLEGAA